MEPPPRIPEERGDFGKQRFRKYNPKIRKKDQVDSPQYCCSPVASMTVGGNVSFPFQPPLVPLHGPNGREQLGSTERNDLCRPILASKRQNDRGLSYLLIIGTTSERWAAFIRLEML